MARQAMVAPAIDLGDHATGRSPYQFVSANVVYGGGVYLVTWLAQGDVLAGVARVSTSGTVLDPTPLLSGNTGGYGAGFDGTNFRLFWQEGSAKKTARVSPAGVVLDNPPVAVGYVGQYVWQVIGCSSANCVIATQQFIDGGLNPTLETGRVGPNGETLDSTLFQVPGSDTIAGNFHGVTTSAGYVIAWEDGASALWTAQFDTNGVFVKTSATGYPSPTAEALPSVASNRSEILVTEYDPLAFTSPLPCYGFRLGPDGAPLDSTPRMYPSGAPCGAVAAGATDFLIASRGQGSLAALEVGVSGAPAAGVVTSTLPVIVPIYGDVLGSDGTGYLDLSFPQTGIQATALDAHGNAVSTPVDVVLAPAIVSAPAVAAGADAFLAVWSDTRSAGKQGVYGTLVGSGGTVIARGLPLAPNAQVHTAAGPPAVAAGGGTYLAAWAQSTGIGAALVAADGAASPSIAVSSAAVDFAPAVASSGDGYLLAWCDTRNLVSDVYAARVDKTGNLLDPSGIQLGTASSALNDGIFPRAAWAGAAYAVAWRHRLPGPSSQFDYEAQIALVSGAGTTVVAPESVSVGQTDVDSVDVACAPSICMVAWTSGGHVWTRRYDASGAPLAMPAVVMGAQDGPRIAWDGTAFVLVSHDSGVYQARAIATDGSASGPPQALFTDADAGGGSIAYALASNATGESVVAEATSNGTTVYGILFTGDGVALPLDGGPPNGADGAGTPDAANAGDGERPDVSMAGQGAAPDASANSGGEQDGAAAHGSNGSGGGAAGDAPGSSSGCGCLVAGVSAELLPRIGGIGLVFLLSLLRIARRRSPAAFRLRASPRGPS
jgi:hypothetical protein